MSTFQAAVEAEPTHDLFWAYLEEARAAAICLPSDGFSPRKVRGQFLTPASVAQGMAFLHGPSPAHVSLLDAGAGVGTLFMACVAELCGRSPDCRPQRITVTAYEIEERFAGPLQAAFAHCRDRCAANGIEFTGELRPLDFLADAARLLRHDLFRSEAASEVTGYTCAILNPPYRKIAADSPARRHLREMGIEVGNLYAGFLAAAALLLASQGELIAITPRSFCNGPYFRDFRRFFLQRMTLRHLHIFDSRKEIWGDDGVLQETLILHATAEERAGEPPPVTLSVSRDGEAGRFENASRRQVPYAAVVHPDDSEQFVRIAFPKLEGLEGSEGEENAEIEISSERFTQSLSELDIRVSTGRVVDFRVKQHLRFGWPSFGNERKVPLLYPANLSGNKGDDEILWPKQTRKPQALVLCPETMPLVVPNECYVLVKRFSAKEEKRRITAVVYDPEQISVPAKWVGFENHLNYFHQNGHGLPPLVARGLAAYLNSPEVDAFFRQFSGHTQVNATDLRSLRYPTREQLETLGREVVEGETIP